MQERSEAQKTASRANGAKSHGPVTEEGKIVSSQNARKHGLYSKVHCTLYESKEQYEGKLESYRAAYQPVTEPEEDLVRAIALAELEYQRYSGDLTALRDIATEAHQRQIGKDWKNFDGLALQTACLLQHGPDALRYFDALGRAQSRARRNSLQAQKQLTALQAERRKREAEASATTEAATHEPAPSTKTQERTQPRPPAPPPLDPMEALNEMLLRDEPGASMGGYSKQYLRSVLASDHYRAGATESRNEPDFNKEDKAA